MNRQQKLKTIKMIKTIHIGYELWIHIAYHNWMKPQTSWVYNNRYDWRLIIYKLIIEANDLPF